MIREKNRIDRPLKRFDNRATVIPDYIWEAYGLPYPFRNFKFHPSRKWEIDFAWPDIKFGIEIQGGVYYKNKSGHTSIRGYERDMEKLNALTTLGWRILWYTPNNINYLGIKEIYKRLKLEEERETRVVGF